VLHLLREGDLVRFPSRQECDFVCHNLSFSCLATGGFELAGKAKWRFRVASDGHPVVSASSNRPLSIYPVAFARLNFTFLF
jgi:hypothetical protein